MRKILGLLVLCLLFTSCSECLHDGTTRQRLFEDEIVNSNKQIITPQIGRQYKIRYPYWGCTDCQNVGKCRIQDVMILGGIKW